MENLAISGDPSINDARTSDPMTPDPITPDPRTSGPITSPSPEVFISMESHEVELARCQPTEQDFNHTLGMIDSYSRAIEEDPFDATAYGDRALALAFLGRDLESRRDQAQATQLGLDAGMVKEEISLIRGVAIGGTYRPAEHRRQPLLNRSAGWLSFVPSLFGR